MMKHEPGQRADFLTLLNDTDLSGRISIRISFRTHKLSNVIGGEFCTAWNRRCGMQHKVGLWWTLSDLQRVLTGPGHAALN